MGFKVGQKVVCISNFPDRKVDEIIPIKNEIYTIRSFDAVDSIYLKEITNKPKMYSEGLSECSFHISGFRPLDYDFVEEVIKQVKPQKQEV